MKLPIVQYPDPILRRICSDVPSGYAPLKKMIVDMKDTASSVRAWGLAAPQIGCSLRVIVIRTNIAGGWISSVGQQLKTYLAMVNPVLEFESEDRRIGRDACLSFTRRGTPVQGQTVRSYQIKVQSDGLIYEATGNIARAVLHEIDHLNGIMWFDKASKS